MQQTSHFKLSHLHQNVYSYLGYLAIGLLSFILLVSFYCPHTVNTSAIDDPSTDTETIGTVVDPFPESTNPETTNTESINIKTANTEAIDLETANATALASSVEYIPSVVNLALSPESITLNPEPSANQQIFYHGATTLTVGSSNNKGYAIYLSSANGQSTMPNTDPSSTAAIQPTTAGVTKSTFTPNTWGYALTTNLATDSTTYAPVPAQFNQRLPIHKEPSATNKAYTINFAAALDNDLPAGQYTTSVTITVIANPAVILKGLDSISTMQQMTPTICAETATPATGIGTSVPTWQLRDTRDGSTYTVTKLKKNTTGTEGWCWMTQNLRLINKKISSTDSDMANGTSFTLPASDKNGFKLADRTDPKAFYENDANGAYYNYYTATAGTGGGIVSGESAPSSICPKGWRLAKNGEYGILTSAYGLSNDNASNITTQPLNFPSAGYIYNSTFYHVGTLGHYWSATAKSSTDAYILYFDSSSNLINTSSDGTLYEGYHVRCVAR